MNNIAHLNAFINTNDLYINSCYNHVLAKIIIFVMISILKHLRIVGSAVTKVVIKTSLLKFSY